MEAAPGNLHRIDFSVRQGSFVDPHSGRFLSNTDVDIRVGAAGDTAVELKLTADTLRRMDGDEPAILAKLMKYKGSGAENIEIWTRSGAAQTESAVRDMIDRAWNDDHIDEAMRDYLLAGIRYVQKDSPFNHG